MAGSGVAAGAVYFLQDRRRRHQAQATAAVLLGDQRAQEPAVRHGPRELRGIGALAVQFTPVLARKVGANGLHRLADFRQLFLIHELQYR